MNQSPPKRGARSFRPATQLVHGGGTRSPFGETSEALFLTQGYVFDSMEACEARFKGEDPGFVYSRYANPTVAMFEERMAAARRRGGGARHGDRHGGGDGGADGAGQGRRSRRRRHARCSAPAATSSRIFCRVTASPRRSSTAPISTSGARRCGRTPRSFFWKARPIPGSTSTTSRRSPRSRMRAARTLVVDNVFATPILQKPLDARRRLVVYSATKHIDGGRAAASAA